MKNLHSLELVIIALICLLSACISDAKTFFKEEGQNLTLTCRIHSDEHDEVSWHKDDKKIYSSNMLEDLQENYRGLDVVTVPENIYRIIVLHVNQSANGSYWCSVFVNNKNYSSIPVDIFIIPKFTVEIKSKNEDGKYFIGQRIELKCDISLDFDQLRSIRWKRNDIDIYIEDFNSNTKLKTNSTANKFEIDENESGNGTLTLLNVQFEASGTYTCEAIRRLTESMKSDSINISMQKLPEYEYEILQEPASNLRVKDDVKLSCQAKKEIKYPIESIKWFKDYKILSTYYPERNKPFKWFTKSSTFFTDAENNGSFIIQHLKTTDSGLYTCILTLKKKNLSHYAANKRITVLPEKNIEIELFVRKPRPNRYKHLQGNNLLLTCDFDNKGLMNYTVKWYRNLEFFYTFDNILNTPVKINHLQGVNLDLDRSTEKALVLVSATKETGGIFSCSVETGYPDFMFSYKEIEVNLDYLE